MRIGATVSDLHLFSHHSRMDRYFAHMEEVASVAEAFVLNGDIFDFKWSEHGIFSRSVQAAEHFLRKLAEDHPDCHFHVVLGNHDAVPPYRRCLEELASQHVNLDWHEFACQLEDRVFLHGDVIHAGSSNAAVRAFRSRLQHPARGLAWHKWAHSAVHRSRVPWAAFRMLPKRLLAVRLLAYLENENWLNGRPVRHIYFGHTHSDFEDFSFRSYRFHNCGSATHGARLRLVTFPMKDSK